MPNDPRPSEGVPQPVESEPLTATDPQSVPGDNANLVQILFSVPQLKTVAQRWGHLADELKEAVLRLVR